MDQDILNMTPEREVGENYSGYVFSREQVQKIIDFLGVNYVAPCEKRVLVLGFKDVWEGVANPSSETDRFDKPGRGLVLKSDNDERGAICHFGKYECTQIMVNGRRFYVINDKNYEKIDAFESLSKETTFGSLLDSAY